MYSVAKQSHQEASPQIIPLGFLDLEGLIEAITRLRGILLEIWWWLYFRRLLIVRLWLEVLLVLRLRLIIGLLVIPLASIVPVRRLLGLGLWVSKALIIVVASSLSTHGARRKQMNNDQMRTAKEEKEKKKRRKKGSGEVT